ncbi:MAG TPA: NAD(P)H-dependent glycerol-3-phosphate dehydrogenase [Actinomycetota bacterium]|nr:NAD(P)H-dependent glycerol-3-phosphate dehydrogenase [Actinomycetota bacterium]
MARITVFGAGAAGTAHAIHLARKGEDVSLWGSEYDARVLPEILGRRAHPALPERIPSELRVLGPEELAEAAKDVEIAVLAANSAGARSLGRMVAGSIPADAVLVSVTKGLERETRRRMTEVYGEEIPDHPVVAVGGPALAPELSEGFLTAVVFGCPEGDPCRRAAEAFRSDRYLVEVTDDVIGVEICATAKNVAAIGAGILEGIAQSRQRDMKNARAALFAQAVGEIADLVQALGGRRETALGRAGMGDLLVTSIGGRNRLYGEAIGLGGDPAGVLEDMKSRGMTVEGAEAVEDVHGLAEEHGLDLPVHGAVYRVVREGRPAETVLEAVR